MTGFLQKLMFEEPVSEISGYANRPTMRFSDRNRFRVEILEDRIGPILRVTDRLPNTNSAPPLFEWRGAVVQQLCSCGVLGSEYQRSRVQYRDKSFVQHLALAAASAELARERLQVDIMKVVRESDRPVTQKLHDCAPSPTAAIGTLPSAFACRVARILRAYPDHHFEFSEVHYMLTAQWICMTEQSLERALHELTDAKLIQSIRIDASTVFYDTNIAPHPHVYDKRNRALRDVAANEIVTA